MIVSKFGGSSVRDAKAIWECVDVVEEREDYGLVIISATYNTTNELEKIFDYYILGDITEAKRLWNSVFLRHKKIAEQLGECFCRSTNEDVLNRLIDLDNQFKIILKTNDKRECIRDIMLSYGERMSSWLFFNALKERLKNKRKVSLIFAPEYIKTNNKFCRAIPNIEETTKKTLELRPLIDSGELLVTQGFIGSTMDMSITTLGREGSDYSATIFGAALGAKCIDIWTDVDGIYNADPNFIEHATRFQELSFFDASLMASHGAKVLFDKTLGPLKGLNIPLRVGKTSSPQLGNTTIIEQSQFSYDLLGLTFKELERGGLLTFLGRDVSKLTINEKEVESGNLFRSFKIENKSWRETCQNYYDKFFNSISHRRV